MTTSPTWKRGVRSLVTLHDLNFWLHPEWYSPSFRAVYRMTALPGLRSAEMVVAVSDWVRTKAEKHLHMPVDRTRRIYNGIKPASLLNLPPRTAPGAPYVLTVGSLQPHKNLRRIMEAFSLLSRTWPELELWVVGRKQPRFRDDNPHLPMTSKVKVLGYLSDQELSEAYLNAALFCYPSLEEGFGLPVLEAMQAGVPVVTSNASCLPEIVGGAAELADPLSTGSIAAAMTKILTLTPAERDRMISAGKERAAQFSWKQSATAYLELYRELMESA